MSWFAPNDCLTKRIQPRRLDTDIKKAARSLAPLSCELFSQGIGSDERGDGLGNGVRRNGRQYERSVPADFREPAGSGTDHRRAAGMSLKRGAAKRFDPLRWDEGNGGALESGLDFGERALHLDAGLRSKG